MSDKGLKTLFFPQNLHGNQDGFYGQCQCIEFLDITGNQVTPQTVAKIYHKHHTIFRNLRYDLPFDVILELMDMNDFDGIKLQTDSLQFFDNSNLNVHVDQLNPNLLENASLMAPNVKIIDFTLSYSNNRLGECVRQIGLFKHLQKLCLNMETSTLEEQTNSHICQKGLNPILSEIGEQLKILHLSNICDLDAGVVFNSCPNLEEMELSANSYVTETIQYCLPDNYPLKRINIFFELGGEADINHPNSSFFIFLGYAKNLEAFSFEHARNFNDELLTEVCQLNSFQNLKQITLTECHNITMFTLEEEILCKNNIPLEFGAFHHCNQITKADAQRYMKYVEHNKYSVRVQWS